MSKYKFLFAAPAVKGWIKKYFETRGSADVIIVLDPGNNKHKIASVSSSNPDYMNIGYSNSWHFLDQAQAEAMIQEGQGASILEYEGNYLRFGEITEANPASLPITLDQKFNPTIYKLMLVAAIATVSQNRPMPRARVLFIVTHATPQSQTHAGCVSVLNEQGFFGSQINYVFGGVPRTATIITEPIRRQESLGAIYGAMWKTKEPLKIGSDLVPNREASVPAEGPHIRLCDLGGGTGLTANIKTQGGIDIVDVFSSAIGIGQLLTPSSTLGLELIEIIRKAMRNTHRIQYTVPFNPSMLRDVLKRGSVVVDNIEYPVRDSLIKFIDERILTVYKSQVYDQVAYKSVAKYHIMTGAGVLLLGPALPIVLNLVDPSQREAYAAEWYTQRAADNLLIPQSSRFGYAETSAAALEYANANGNLLQFFIDYAASLVKKQKDGTAQETTFS